MEAKIRKLAQENGPDPAAENSSILPLLCHSVLVVCMSLCLYPIYSHSELHLYVVMYGDRT